MVKEFKKIGEIKETHSLRVSAHGDGLYLYLPKSLKEVYAIMAGDRIKARLLDHLRPQSSGEGGIAAAIQGAG